MKARPKRRYLVSFTNTNGITRVANVIGDVLYEAAVAALDEFKTCGFTNP